MDDFAGEGNWRVNPVHKMSTTLEKALGEVGLWDRAEVAIASAMDNFAGEGNWRVNRRLEEAPCSGGGLYSAVMSNGRR